MNRRSFLKALLATPVAAVFALLLPKAIADPRRALRVGTALNSAPAGGIVLLRLGTDPATGLGMAAGAVAPHAVLERDIVWIDSAWQRGIGVYEDEINQAFAAMDARSALQKSVTGIEDTISIENARRLRDVAMHLWETL